MSDDLVLQVITASTRPGRVGRSVADWFVPHAREHGGFTVEDVDLEDVALPLLDEPNHPRLRDYTHEHTKAWSATVDRADAYVFVMPEYNYGFSGALKNAVDYLFHEWQHKPVSFVSYGGVSGGLRAVQMFKQVVTTLRMYPTQAAVSIPLVAGHVDDGGRFVPTDPMREAADATLTELNALAAAVRPLRG